MMLLCCPWVLDVEVIGAVTVVRFTPQAARDDTTSYDVGKFLLGLAEDGARRIVLNLGLVDYLNSLMIGKFFTLQKKVKMLGGHLVLCRVAPPLHDLFALVKLAQRIVIVESEDEALAALELWPSPQPPRPVRSVAEQPIDAAALVNSPIDGTPLPGWCASS